MRQLYSNLQSGINDAIESIKHFISIDEQTGQRPQDRDIEILQAFPDVDNDAMKQAICDYFDPYSDRAGKVRHIYSCLVGYDEEIYHHLLGSSITEIEEYFKQKYIKKAVATYNTFSRKIQNAGLAELEFILILLPFKDINKLRESFKAKLRVNPNDK